MFPISGFRLIGTDPVNDAPLIILYNTHMKPIIFNGRDFADEKEEELKIVVSGLRSRGIVPHLASILVGDDEASRLYIGLKKKAVERIGAEHDSYFLPENTKLSDILALIASLNEDKNVQGIMVQMPIPGQLGNHKDEIIKAIDPKKDVDGLRDDSSFLHPTSRAIIDIINEAKRYDNVRPTSKTTSLRVVVVGATGMVGRPLVKELKKEGYEVIGCDSKTMDLKNNTLKGDILVSVTGVPGIIKADMVKRGTIVIDVGSPVGDFDPEVKNKSAFFTPVPGGVGPVTIACLLENLIDAC